MNSLSVHSGDLNPSPEIIAEAFMAGDPLNGGGFVILNGIGFNEEGELEPYRTPYSGGNLFSLASGGAIFLRDPHRQVTAEQLNGGAFASMTEAHWDLIKPLLLENEVHFGIPLETLLQVDGEPASPMDVYRLIVPVKHEALQPEEAWVRQQHPS
jgi:hypothetical protein